MTSPWSRSISGCRCTWAGSTPRGARYYARALGCASVDGTTLAVSPGNLPALLRWLEASDTAARDGSLFDVFAPTA